MGTLFLVATPIGNLEDISARALRVLQEVRLIAAEDTRQTRKLLTHFNFHTPLTSYFEHNKLGKLDLILDVLSRGNVALVSDAGTPALNDPGVELVQAALQAGYNVSPIPGPAAPLAALVASGLPTHAFLYLGYLPRRSSERCTFLARIVRLPYTLIFLETPHRLLASLIDLETILGDRRMAVAREMTKVHEEIWRGTISKAREHFTLNQPRGEFTLVVAGREGDLSGEMEAMQIWTEEDVRHAILSGLRSGESPSQMVRRLPEETGWGRRKIYNLVNQLK